MKPGESVDCKVKYAEFLNTEKPGFKSDFTCQENQDLQVKAEITKLVKIDDLFGDGALLKRLIRKGIDTQKAEKNTQLTFDISIFVDEKEIYTSKLPTDNLQELQKVSDGAWKTYLDEYTISKALKTAIKRVKKHEISEIICNDPKWISSGRDYDIIKQHFPETP